MCYTYTDSCVLWVETQDIYKDMLTFNNHVYDFSNYPKDHFLYSDSNNWKLGTFKDETKSEPIEIFVGLRAKMYTFLMTNRKETMVAKGIRTSNLSFEQ